MSLDPHENDSDSGIGRVIDGLEILQNMNLYHGGTSTGSFIEEVLPVWIKATLQDFWDLTVEPAQEVIS